MKQMQVPSIAIFVILIVSQAQSGIITKSLQGHSTILSVIKQAPGDKKLLSSSLSSNGPISSTQTGDIMNKNNVCPEEDGLLDLLELGARTGKWQEFHGALLLCCPVTYQQEQHLKKVCDVYENITLNQTLENSMEYEINLLAESLSDMYLKNLLAPRNTILTEDKNAEEGRFFMYIIPMTEQQYQSLTNSSAENKLDQLAGISLIKILKKKLLKSLKFFEKWLSDPPYIVAPISSNKISN